VAVIEPGRVPAEISPCPAYLTGWKVMDLPQPLRPEPVIEDSRYDLVIEFDAVEFRAPHQVVYRTGLIGLKEGWSRVSGHRHTRYTNLRPGKYRFEVQARNYAAKRTGKNRVEG
jgi:hypothetical protein